MNATQRKFLIEKIQDKTKKTIEVLKNSRLSYPSASNHIFRAILNDNLKLQHESVIMQALKTKALNAKEGENWLSRERMGFYKETTVMLDITSLIHLPDDYSKEVERVKQHNESINKKIEELSIQLDTIEVRIQLASDNTLKKLINEVDDMGEVSLIDSKLKLLGT